MKVVRRLYALMLLIPLAADVSAQTRDTVLPNIVGAYRSASGALFLVGSASADAIHVRDLQGGLRGRFALTAPDRFELEGVTVRVLRDEREIVGLEIAAPSVAARVAERVPLRFEEVGWTSAGTGLAGTLVLPSGEGPFALVIAQPGSSWQTRFNEHGMFTALTFAAHGIAGLAYDKRGFGASGGEQLVEFRTTAADLAAGVEAMRLRFDLNPDHIGVFGLSQGGWIAPLANTMTDGIRYLVLVGAPGTTPARQEIQRAMQVLRAEEYPAVEVEAIREFQEIAFRYGSTGEGWQEYLAARSRAEGKGWLRRVWSPLEPGADNWMWGRLNGHYNPLPALLEVRVPVLALWGEFDLNVHPEVNRSIFEVALEAAGNRDHTLVVVREADHELEAATSPRAALATEPFAPGVWDQMMAWLQQRVRQRDAR
ncbi:MAG: alpha/beta hydrolase [Gemmatimonadales bacterium]